MSLLVQPNIADRLQPGTTPVVKSEISDRRFMRRVRQVLALRDFIVREMQEMQKSSRTELSCEGMYPFTYARSGRKPLDSEWNELESKVFDLNESITSEQRKKFVLSQFPLIIIYVAVFSLALSMASLVSAVYPGFLLRGADADHLTLSEMFAFVLWTISLGALGSIAFISVNGLSMQSDATFDVTNTRFVLLRIILGALFGVLIALPISYTPFLTFCQQLASAVPAVQNSISSSQVLYLLLPFLVGFSASLFMTIINKLMAGVQSIFGVDGPRKSGSPAGQPAAAFSGATPPSIMG